MPIDPAALEALRLLLDAAGPDRVVVIGASVPIVLIDLRYGLTGGRTTRDVDAVVRATSWEEYEELKQRLLAAGFRQGRVAQRLEFGPAELDLIPYSGTLAPGAALEWPGQNRVMSALGFEEAFESARPEQVGDLVVPMASVAACVLLKFVAYNDRPAERVRDLLDIVHCFEHYGDEAFCMRLAKHLGLPVSPVETAMMNGRRLIIVERYDRIVHADGTVERIHQEDFCQATAIPPEKKYEEDGGPTLRRMAGILQGVAGPDSLETLLRAVTINLLIGNGDAHGKNFSLLHDASGSLRLAPLYDLLSTLAYGDDRLAMSIDNVQRTNRVTADRIVNEAARWGLSRRRASEIIAEVLGRARAAAQARPPPGDHDPRNGRSGCAGTTSRPPPWIGA